MNKRQWRPTPDGGESLARNAFEVIQAERLSAGSIARSANVSDSI